VYTTIEKVLSQINRENIARNIFCVVGAIPVAGPLLGKHIPGVTLSTIVFILLGNGAVNMLPQ
jgi:hypothetical protein